MHAPRATETNFDEKLLELSSEIDEFEGYTHAHGLRIAAIADSIGKYFNLAAHDRFFMQQAALLHDIGEMVMNRDYIRQNRPLSASERLDMQRHPVIGEQEASKRGYSRGVQLLIRWHHEWWNGSGYPDALEGEQIPLAARILRVADSFAALRDDRPRRKAMTVSEAKAYIVDWTGIEFDPRVVQAFFSCDYIDLEVERRARPETPPPPREKEALDVPRVTTVRSGLFPVDSPPQLESAPVDEQPLHRFANND
ncbi:MAG: HD domain-containing protein [Chloracidobacterium sp.]|nr:HD domain-containing protein [Chloracidobacterium sp.]